MAILDSVPVYDWDLFTVHGKEIATEGSNLREHGYHAPLYPDAAMPDVGFGIRRGATGHVAYFVHSSVQRDSDGEDILSDTFVPTPESLRMYPGLKGWTVVVFND
jgi:hypothetical protein